MESIELTEFDKEYAAVRRSIIDCFFSRMNDKQREAVYHTEGPLLVLAGAGSGKTTVLIQRMINIIRFGQAIDCAYAKPGASQEDLDFLKAFLRDPQPEQNNRAIDLCTVNPARPWEVIAITFTNKAARELRERLEKAIGPEEASSVWAYTFHTACLRILRSNIDRLGYESSFTIYDEDDKKRLIRTVIKDMNLDEKVFDLRQVIGMISRAKDTLQTPDSYADQSGGEYFRTKVADIYREYEKRMKQANALDFDDIIMKTVQLLKRFPDVLEYYQNKFRYVMVDEYQDTNHAQYVLTALLADGHKNICVVGDDDQSIYKFRGATIKNILEFEKQYADTCTIRLEQNYRSTDIILDAANAVIRNNCKRKGKELWTEYKNGEKIKLHRAGDQDAEADYIATEIKQAVQSGKAAYSDFAVLYRNNVLSNNIEQRFSRLGIPYRIYKGRDFFSRAEIKDVFAYLWLIQNPTDNLRLKRIINIPSRKIGARSLELAEQEAFAAGKSMFEIVRNATRYSAIPRAAAGSMERFGQMIEVLHQQAEYLLPSEIYEEMLSRSGYEDALQEKNDEDSHSRLENILELKSNIVQYEEKADSPNLSDFLEEMALYTDADDARDENEDHVLMMTMHSAKGLEFPTVFVAGMEDGIFPSFRSEANQDDMEEERRLCYVAITRAKKYLYLTCAERRMLYGQTVYSRVSRFAEEIPNSLVDSNVSAQSVERQREEVFRNRPSSATVREAYRSALTAVASSRPPVPHFAPGDQVTHRIFGGGMVTAVTPMGNDSLLEIAFESKGTKRLMAKMAAAMLKKK